MPPVAPTPSTLWVATVAVGTSNVAVPLPVAETTVVATVVVAVLVSYHSTVTVSPAAYPFKMVLTDVPSGPVPGERLRLGSTANAAASVSALVAPVPEISWSPIAAAGTVKEVVALPVADVVTVLIGVASPSQAISTVSPAPYPVRLTSTVSPTGPEAGETVRRAATVKGSEAFAALVAPTPSTLWAPAVAAGTSKVAVALP